MQILVNYLENVNSSLFIRFYEMPEFISRFSFLLKLLKLISQFIAQNF